MCQDKVPAESTKNFSLGNLDASSPSANGDLQIFPKHTITILIGIAINSISN
jgi:hypothetical protein